MKSMAKFIERLRARELRKDGESIRSIAQKVRVSKSSVSMWCGDIELTKAQKEKLVADDRVGGEKGRQISSQNKIKERLCRMGKYKDAGRKMVGKINKRELFLVGIALYWAEGNKKDRRLVFTNSDPEMIKIWIRWLVDCLAIPAEDIYCYLGINEVHKKKGFSG